MRIKPAYTVHDKNPARQKFKCKQLTEKNSNFSATLGIK